MVFGRRLAANFTWGSFSASQMAFATFLCRAGNVMGHILERSYWIHESFWLYEYMITNDTLQIVLMFLTLVPSYVSASTSSVHCQNKNKKKVEVEVFCCNEASNQVITAGFLLCIYYFIPFFFFFFCSYLLFSALYFLALSGC